MATIKVNGAGYFISSSKITTPSIKIDGQGYVPLFVGNKGSTVDYNRYRYTLGGLKIGNYHAAISREFINHAPTATLSASATRVANGTSVTLTCTASDPDGDSLGNFRWYQKVNGSWNDGSNFGSTRVLSYSDTTREYYVVVTDPYGASVTTNIVEVTWYNPNHAPYITIGNTPGSSSDGNINFTISYHDDDSDTCTVQYGDRTFASGGISYENTQRSFTTGTSPSNATIYVAVKAPKVNGYYHIFARITDSSGASDASYRAIPYVAPLEHAYKCKVKCYRIEEKESDGPYGGSKKDAWYADETPIKYPSQYAGLEIIRYDMSTVTIQPYVIETYTEEEWVPSGYGGSWKNVTKTRRVYDGTAHTFAVTFPSNQGRQYTHTYTFEWD